MKVKPKSVKRDVTLMVDPNPTHLSAVNHGANQAPWKAVKGHQKDTSDMALKTQGSKDSVIKMLTLSKSVYSTEKSVSEYMAKKGWDADSYAIEDDTDMWIARSTDEYPEGYLAEKSRSVATKDNGVFMHVLEVIGELDDSGNVVKADPGITTTAEENDDVDGESDQDVTEGDVPGAGAVGKPGSTDATGEGKDMIDQMIPNPLVTGKAATIKVKPKPAAKAIIVPEVVDASGDGDDEETSQEVITEDIPHDNAAGINRAAGDMDDEDEEEKPATKATKRATATGVTIKEDGDEDEENATKSMIQLHGGPVLAEKYSWWAYSDDTSLLEVIEDGMSYDHLPPGMDELFAAIQTCAGNILGSQEITDKQAALAQLGAEFARITHALYELFTKSMINLSNEDAQKWVTSFKASILTETAKAKEEPEEGAETTTKTIRKAVKKAENPTDIAGQIAKGIAEGMKGVEKQLTERIEGVSSEVKQMKKTLGNVAKDRDEETPTRKSMADAFDEMTEPANANKQDAPDSEGVQIAKGALGWRSATRR